MPLFPRLAAATLALGLLAAACGGGEERASSNSVAGLEFATFDGEDARFDDHEGQPLVINFFAEWCPNCIAEMPDFEAVFQDFDGDVSFVGVSIDRASDDALQLVADTGITYDVGWDPGEEIYAHFRALAMPTTVFVHPDGSIARVWSGALDADGLTDLINEEIL